MSRHQPRPPRQVLPWEDYFLGLAKAASSRSKDPDTQVGCVIVDHNNNIVSTGYNGPPPGGDDEAIDWARPHKYDWVLHAEENALLRAPLANLAACTLYVTGHPCPHCMLMIAGKRLRRVVWSPLTIQMCNPDTLALACRIACLYRIEVLLWEPPTP